MGVERRRGELFTEGAIGYTNNYRIVGRVGSEEYRRDLHGVAWLGVRDAIADLKESDNTPYITELIRCQESVLSSALHDDRGQDFTALVGGFSGMFENLRELWRLGIRSGPDNASVERLERTMRVGLMGLAGRAMVLAEEGQLRDPQPYIEVARSQCPNLERLASDSAVIHTLDAQGTFSWLTWESEGLGVQIIDTTEAERYPLAFASLRLLELAQDPMPTLDLEGAAQRVFDGYQSLATLVDSYLRPEPGAPSERRRGLVSYALQVAVRREEAAQSGP